MDEDTELRLYIRISEAIECASIVTSIIEQNHKATAFDCLSALIERRKELEREINDSIIKEIIE